jgi:hypothetical protein
MRTLPDEAQHSRDGLCGVLLERFASRAREMESRCLRMMPARLSESVGNWFQCPCPYQPGRAPSSHVRLSAQNFEIRLPSIVLEVSHPGHQMHEPFQGRWERWEDMGILSSSSTHSYTALEKRIHRLASPILRHYICTVSNRNGSQWAKCPYLLPWLIMLALLASRTASSCVGGPS